jgi:NADH-quinone oxidoreductase subunit L
MFLALGTGTVAGITAGMFHLVTHAFFKALLFLGAGSVMHATGGIIDMRRLGGLRRALPVAHWTFLIGCLALAGVPPLAGFWSKDAILGAVEERAHAGGGDETHVAVAMVKNADGAREDGEIGVVFRSAKPASGVVSEWFHLTAEQMARAYWWLFGGALFTALLTGFYTFRAYFMTFCGPMRTPVVGHAAHDDDEAHAHHAAAVSDNAHAPDDAHRQHGAQSHLESHSHEPAIMYAPLILLAVGAVVAGLLLDQSAFGGPHLLAEFLARSPSLSFGAAGGHVGLEFDLLLAGLSALVALAAIGAAAYLYLGDPRDIQRLTSLLRFDWLDRVADRQWVAELRRRPWVIGLETGANRVGLGWLAAIVGNVFLLVVLLVTTPLMLLPLVSPYRLSLNKFYVDEIYAALIVWPLRGIAAVCGWLDRWLVDGTVNTVGRVPPAVGSVLRRMQTGLAPLYALAMLMGTLLLVIVWLLVPPR